MKRAITALFFVAALGAVVPAPASPIAYWAANGNTVDSVAARNGTLINGAGFAAGAVSQAFSLDGVNQYVSVADDDVWTFGGDFTIALWASFDSIRSGGFFATPNVFIAHDQGAGQQPKWSFFYADSGQLVFHINETSPLFLPSPSTFIPSLGDWHHYAITRSGSTFTFYVDGVSLGTATSAEVLANAAAPLTIGQAEGLGYFDGRLDEIRLYSNALSTSEIEALATVPAPGSLALVGLGLAGIGWSRRKKWEGSAL